MKRLVLASLLLVASTTFAQSVVGVGGQTAASFATSLAQCPTLTTPGTYYLCIVVPPSPATPFLALSVAGYQAGAPFAIVTPPATTVPVVLSVNNKKPDSTGNVSLSISVIPSTTLVVPAASPSLQ